MPLSPDLITASAALLTAGGSAMAGVITTVLSLKKNYIPRSEFEEIQTKFDDCEEERKEQSEDIMEMKATIDRQDGKLNEMAASVHTLSLILSDKIKDK